ncbi:MOSC domain-containing protein [Paenibacillus sp. YN15]|uniref:MOSC domain-containing protein n=1 Tax=Paenibacillus sp. YN15 TaxID=1742774 RepID=UPI000DCDA703|nr:MOSC domain-containing protein [Paenibacillus sp. YN15]RAU95325.1 MOSC domain-containing protein [Paenibacillus sp. YN15]
MVKGQSGRLRSLQVGKPAVYQWGGKEFATGMGKLPAAGKLLLTFEGYAEDGQADRIHHGGRDKAVCVYAYEHYAYWEKELGQSLVYAAFGENVTMEGLTEQDVCIGDVYRMGEALVQVSQPRQPCYKLGHKYNRTDMPLLVQTTGYTGYYFRVLEEGCTAPGDAVLLVERSPAGITVAEANRIKYTAKDDQAEAARLLAVPGLSDSWRESLAKRLS